MIAMIVINDLSSLYSLIGAVVSESISYAIYCCKSFNDTREEKRNKLERDKWEADLSSNESDDDPEDFDSLEEDPIPEDDDHSGDIPDDEIMEESEGNNDE